MNFISKNEAIYNLAEVCATEKFNEGKITYAERDLFLEIISRMYPTESKNDFSKVMKINNECINNCLDIGTDLLKTESVDNIDAEVIKIADIMPQEVPDNLPTTEEYSKRSEEYAREFIKIASRQYSEPCYLCPLCQAGGMCRDETVNLLSYPPHYKYVCNKCE